jgi:CheY-like chemotaxis protein
VAKHGCILIVEDSPVLANALELWLRECGYDTCRVASSVQEAIEAAAANQPILIFMDLRLAGRGDGVHATEQIRKIHDCPIIFLTGDIRPEAISRIREADPTAILKKPFSPETLENALREALKEVPKQS